jgi:ribosomal protein L11 methyltransferase
MPQLAVRIDLEGLEPEAVDAALEACGALSISYADRRDDPILEPAPGEFRLWPSTRVEALFDAETAAPALVAALCARLGVAATRLELAAVGDRAWEREWLRDFHAMRFGRRLWICPSHEVPDASPGAAIVRLDPGLAFGTGTHATTRLCLEWLDEQLRQGESLIDYGCGSGVLAIAGLALGAGSAAAFDIDAQALLATRDNAIANGVAARLSIVAQAGRLPRAADVLVANILAGPLCALAGTFARHVRPGGRLVLAGLLTAQAGEVAAAQARWFDVRPWRELDGWTCLQGIRSGHAAAPE